MSSGVRKSIEKHGQEICGVIEISSDKSVWLLKSPGIKKCVESSENLEESCPVVAFSMIAEEKKPPVLKIFQKLEEQPLKTPEDLGKRVKTPGTPEKIDPSKIPISSTPELSDLKQNPADNSILRSIFEEIEKASNPRKKKKSKDKKKKDKGPEIQEIVKVEELAVQETNKKETTTTEVTKEEPVEQPIEQPIEKSETAEKMDVSDLPETQNSTIESNNSFSSQSQADRSKENFDTSNSLKHWEDKRNTYHEEVINGEVITVIHRKKKHKKHKKKKEEAE